MTRTNEQEQCFEKFSKLKVGAVFMKMGTGKTKVACDLINYNKSKIDVALFFTLVSLKDELESEVLKCGVDIQHLIVGYETIAQSDKEYLSLLERLEGKSIFLVCDESIKLKNGWRKTFKRCLRIRNVCDYVLILNGTPLTRDEWDLYWQMHFLHPKIINMNADEFRATFFKQIRSKKRNQRERTWYEFSDVNAQHLSKLIAPYIFEADLKFGKNVDEYEVVCSSSQDTYDSYIAHKYDFLDALENGFDDGVLSHFVRMQETSAYDENKNKEVAHYISNKQIICFCSYKAEVKQIVRHLNDECFVITGTTPKRMRRLIINGFKQHKKPLIITLGVGAFGHNLQFCNHIVFSSYNFDYGKIEQAMHRIKRIGQLRDIEYIFFTTDLGISRYQKDNLQKKESLHYLVKNNLHSNFKKNL